MEAIVNKYTFSEKLRAYFDLTKFRLSSTVVFSGAVGFIMGSAALNYGLLALFAVAAFLTTAAANIVNQIIEKDLDVLMKRTSSFRAIIYKRSCDIWSDMFVGFAVYFGLFLQY